MNKYLIASLIVNLLLIIILIIYYMKNRKTIRILSARSNKLSLYNNITFNDIFEDILTLINYKVKMTYEKTILPLTNKEIKNGKSKPSIIDDSTTNTIVFIVVEDIMKILSPEYKEKMSMVIDSNNIQDFITSLVYDVVSKVVMEANKETIRKMN